VKVFPYILIVALFFAVGFAFNEVHKAMIREDLLYAHCLADRNPDYECYGYIRGVSR